MKNADVDISRNTYGECEGLITVTVKKNKKILTLINAYKEAPRANFKIDDGEFIKGTLGEFETASSEGTDDRTQRYTYLMCDANIRVGLLQDRSGCFRGGEATEGGMLRLAS